MKSSLKRFSFFLILVFLLQLIPSFSASAEEALNDVKEGVVQVLAICYEDGKATGYRNGAGFAVGPKEGAVKYILTNYYIVDPSAWPQGADLKIYIGVNDDLLDVRDVIRNSESKADLAVLELEEAIDECRNLTISSVLPDTAETLNSISYEDLFDANGEFMLSQESIVENKGNMIEADFQADDGFSYMKVGIAPPNFAFYGSPLVTEDGYVAGINTNVWEDSSGVKHTLAIPGSYIINYLLGIGLVSPEVYDPDNNWKPSPFGAPLSSMQQSGYLSGEWGSEPISTKTGGNSTQSAYYLDTPVKNCKELTVEIGIGSYTGYLFDWWYLDARDLNGNWSHVGSFKLDKKAIEGGDTYVVKFNKPISFDALSVVLASKYNSASWSYSKLAFRDAK